jgi:hypothetical protein
MAVANAGNRREVASAFVASLKFEHRSEREKGCNMSTKFSDPVALSLQEFPE